VILLNSARQVLLLKFFLDPVDVLKGHGWTTPGGGVHDGEPLDVAAARELREEIGLLVRPDALGQPVAYRAGYADLGWARGMFREDFFLYLVDDHQVDTAGMEPLERSHHAGHRWWRPDELSDTSEVVHPSGLAPLLDRLRTGGVPPHAVELPWQP